MHGKTAACPEARGGSVGDADEERSSS
jgi:hypothetical protein